LFLIASAARIFRRFEEHRIIAFGIERRIEIDRLVFDVLAKDVEVIAEKKLVLAHGSWV
jgi:hypothetical protein